MSRQMDAAAYLTGGWAGLDQQPEELSEEDRIAAEQVQAEQDEIDDAIAATFSSKSGKKVLDWLRGMTIEQPSFVADIANPAEAGFIREGQNSIYREFVNRMKRSKERGL